MRPFSKKEKAAGCEPVVVADSENAAVFVQNPNPSHVGPPKTFMFDLVFDSNSKQVRTATRVVVGRSVDPIVVWYAVWL